MVDYIQEMVERHPSLEPVAELVRKACALMIHTYEQGGKLLVCGNGGSAADSEHIVGELMKGFLLHRPLKQEERQKLARISGDDYLADHLQRALPAISLVSHPALSTAFANDVAADMVFAQQVYGYGQPGKDLLIALTTSGNSANVVRAAQVSRAMGIAAVGITGAGGGKLAELCDVCICLPAQSTPQVQELTLPVYHALCAQVEDYFFGQQL